MKGTLSTRNTVKTRTTALLKPPYGPGCLQKSISTHECRLPTSQISPLKFPSGNFIFYILQVQVKSTRYFSGQTAVIASLQPLSPSLTLINTHKILPNFCFPCVMVPPPNNPRPIPKPLSLPCFSFYKL